MTHYVYEKNNWKCGELVLFFPPSAVGFPGPERRLKAGFYANILDFDALFAYKLF